MRDYKKGEEVEAVVLAIDVERERISLGIKQLEGDPFTNFVATHDKGAIVNGTVKSVDAKGAVIDARRRRRRLPARVGNRARPRRGHPHAPEGRRYGQRDDHQHRPQEPRSINLSIKAKDNADETEAMQTHAAADERGASAGTTNLGALLKAKLDNKNS